MEIYYKISMGEAEKKVLCCSLAQVKFSVKTLYLNAASFVGLLVGIS